jgi:hypothetical protein
MPWLLYPGKETQYPPCWRLGEPHSQSGWVQKILPPPGLDPQTVQPVQSGYTECATWPTSLKSRGINNRHIITHYCINGDGLK